MLEVFDTVAAMKAWARGRRRDGRSLGLVPTMGYLHEGHLSLLRQARRECDAVVISIFVNPTQFGPGEDLASYPKDLKRDLALASEVPVDAAFCPTPAEMYPEPYFTYVDVATLTAGLCGASRPGHFRGVATVVTKLLQILGPDRAYFGAKDAQQLAVIRRLAADLNFDTAIVGVPTVREPDGLALSSRNVYLSPGERRAAPVLYRALQAARAQAAAGERDAGQLLATLQSTIAAEPLARIDYAAVVDPVTLQPITRLCGQALAAVAVRFGKARLIDNMLLP